MLSLVLACAFLLVSHFGMSAPAVRPSPVRRGGDSAFAAAYSLPSSAAFVWAHRWLFGGRAFG